MVLSKPQWLLSPNFSKARPERLSDNGDTSRGALAWSMNGVCCAPRRARCGALRPCAWRMSTNAPTGTARPPCVHGFLPLYRWTVPIA